MEKAIRIGDKAVLFKATAGTARRYRQRFNGDLMVELTKLLPHLQKGELESHDLEVFENMAYTMAKQADPTIPEDPDEWLDEFEVVDIYQILPELVNLWMANEETSVESKKKTTGRQSGR